MRCAADQRCLPPPLRPSRPACSYLQYKNVRPDCEALPGSAHQPHMPCRCVRCLRSPTRLVLRLHAGNALDSALLLRSGSSFPHHALLYHSCRPQEDLGGGQLEGLRAALRGSDRQVKQPCRSGDSAVAAIKSASGAAVAGN